MLSQPKKYERVLCLWMEALQYKIMLTLRYHAGHYPVRAREVLDGDLHWIVTLQKAG